jgi:peptide/nickel transport system permease protein
MYVIKKVLATIPLILGVVTLVFFLIEVSPGSIVDKFVTPETDPDVKDLIIKQFGLDQPAYIRYFKMLGNLAIFEFGVSMSKSQPVWVLIGTALPNTLILSGVTMCVIFPTAILIGTYQAVRHNRLADASLSVGTLTLYSMPSFWLALILQMLVVMYYQPFVDGFGLDGDLAFWLEMPISGKVDAIYQDDFTPWEYTLDVARHLLLPGLAMGLASAAGTARYMRSTLLDVIQQDYVRTARAKGLTEFTVISKHAMRNALLPIITIFGLSIPFLFSGSVLVELVFGWPGMGRLIIDAIYQQDVPLIVACFYIFTLFVVAGNLLADIGYALVDPRVRLT